MKGCTQKRKFYKDSQIEVQIAVVHFINGIFHYWGTQKWLNKEGISDKCGRGLQNHTVGNGEVFLNVG